MRIKITSNELKNIKDYIKESFEKINSIDDIASDNFNKSILWFSFLESIGNIYYYEDNPGKRFTKVLEMHCDWKYAKRIISPLFYFYLKENHPCLNKTINDLEEFCWGNQLRNISASSRIISACQLPTIEEIKEKTKLNIELIEKFKLSNLLWQIRNLGIHARWRGDFTTLALTDFCFSCDLDKESNKNWRIYVPEPFLQKLAKSALDNFNTDTDIEIKLQGDELQKILIRKFSIA